MGVGYWQGGTVQGAEKMNNLKEENILCVQNVLKYGIEYNKFQSKIFLFIISIGRGHREYWAPVDLVTSLFDDCIKCRLFVFCLTVKINLNNPPKVTLFILDSFVIKAFTTANTCAVYIHTGTCTYFYARDM